ncbi:MAG: hypothetical protein ACLQVI_39390 [Polyangiaceae bacterium]|jgi:hypothetical protein
MNIQEAAKTAETFLTKYTIEKKHFRRSSDEKDFTLKLRLVQPRPDGETIRLTFHRNGDLGLKDVEFDALAEQCIDALLAAHPDVGDFEFEYYYTG